MSGTSRSVQERAKDWQARFGRTLGLTCRELTGDSEDTKDLDAADIICITPEKFDSLTRKHKDHGGMRFFGEVCLITCRFTALLRTGPNMVHEADVEIIIFRLTK